MEFITHRKHATNLADWERGASLAAGGLLAAAGIAKGWPKGIACALFGAAFIQRGLTGHSLLYEIFGIRTAPPGQGAETTSVPYELGLRVDHSITIDRPRPEVFQFFRDLRNLPRFMRHIRAVTLLDDRRSHWVVSGPAGKQVEWDAVIHNEQENERLAWRTLPGADVDHAGSVLFRDAPAGRGAEVRVELQYNPPLGAAGALLSKLWGEEPTQQIEEDLRRLKQILEAGEALTTEGQGTERRRGTRPPLGDAAVDLASEDSFPASDAPAYTP